MSHFLLDTGIHSLGAIWFPFVLWTWLSMIFWLGLTWFRKTGPMYQYHLRVALLVGLPLGLLSSNLFGLISSWYANPVEGLQAGLMLIKNPIPADYVNITGSINTDWSNPYVWIGYTTVLCGLVSLLKLAALFEKYGDLYHTVKNTKTYYLEEVLALESPLKRPSSGKDILVAFSPVIATPFTFGWRTPVIMLPDSLEKKYGRLNLILSHESVHIKRADFILDGTVQVIKALFWFHPLVRMFARESALYREISCDSEVLQNQAVSMKEYARLLYEMLRPTSPGILYVIRMLSDPSQLRQRISTMNLSSNYVPSPGRSKFMSLVTAVMLSGLIGCSEIQSPSLHWSYTIDLNQQFLTVEVPLEGGKVALEGYEITMDELDVFLNDWENSRTIVHLKAEQDGYYISDKLIDVQTLLRRNNILRISYSSL